MKRLLLVSACLLNAALLFAGKPRDFDVKSPGGAVTLHVTVDSIVQWSVIHKGQQVILPSKVAMHLDGGEILGENVRIISAPVENINTEFKAIDYIKSTVRDQCTQLTINFKGDYSIVFRVYDDAAAYRFVTRRPGSITIKSEDANFNFADDDKAFLPIQWDYRAGKIFNSSFEALYHEVKLSNFPKDSLAFLPCLIDIGQGKKAVLLEGDLQDYPGMYLDPNTSQHGLKGVYARYPLSAEVHGINYIPNKRAGYIAETSGTRSFPWRIVVISGQDKDLLNQDIIQKLASPPQLTDYSWVKPGQVAWDWWNNWNVTHVDFKAGVNTATYKYYIDFASANHIPYIIMDAGWSPELDMLNIIHDINLQEIIDYGKQKNVGVILWATWYAVDHQMEKAFPLYAKMGIKGFKIDFFDRDDQVVVASTFAIAKLAAQYQLMVDYHGMFKPGGLQRTYPNVIGFEGVKGLENFKWANEDQPRYVNSIPYIRMMAGPMDYTPGAMRNATQAVFRTINDNPMSKGTRCQQLAEYVIFTAPLQMLSDNPTIYMREQECTDFITKVPTVFDETVPLDGKVGEYTALARRKGDTWFVGATTNWTPRELTLDFSFLPPGNYQAEIFKDGVNAGRDATDYKKETINLKSGDKIPVQLYGGGGWAARVWPVK
ncbi:MAG TPA: glycoside hydrolase family 97 protein [Mucilaginibacter sp.]|jgi:alpha-glucosidase|nr:glycoside hydrolase family 97 protein [Mucilaginibacter sp.]